MNYNKYSLSSFYLVLCLYIFSTSATFAAIGDILWKKQVGKRIYATAVVWKDKVIFGNDDGKIYALSYADGDEQWALTIGSPVRSSPVIHPSGLVIIGADDGYVYALQTSTGQLQWKFKTKARIRSAPAIGLDGTVFFGSHDNFIYALNGHNGKLIWKTRTEGPVEGMPVVGNDGTVTVGSMDGKLYHLDTLSGELRWQKSSTDALLNQAVAIDQDGKVFFANNGSGLSVLDNTGTNIVQAPLFGRANGVILDRLGGIYSVINLSTGEHVISHYSGQLQLKNKFKGKGWLSSPPVIGAEQQIFFGTDNKQLISQNKNGELNWTLETNGALTASPVLTQNGVLLIGDHAGYFYAVKVPSGGNWPMLGQNPQRTGQVLKKYYLPGEILSKAPNSTSHPEIKLVNKNLDNITSKDIAQFRENNIYAVDPGQVEIQWKNYNDKSIGKPERFFIAAVPVQSFTVGEEIPVPVNASIALTTMGPTVSSSTDQMNIEKSAVLWHLKRKRLYAVRPGHWKLTWKTEAGTDIPVSIQIKWPSDANAYQKHISNTPPIKLVKDYSYVALWHREATPSMVEPKELTDGLFTSEHPGRSIVIAADESNPTTGKRLDFIIVQTLPWDQRYKGERTADIGETIPYTVDFPNEHDQETGSAWVINEKSKFNAQPSYYDRSKRTGPIIPVNIDDPQDEHDDMVLIFYQFGCANHTYAEKQQSAFPGWRDEARFYGTKTRHQTVVIPSKKVDWPISSARYRSRWSNSTDQIIISAQNKKAVVLDNSYFGQAQIYRQNNPNAAGYNPNEEHAFIEGSTLYALRNDLNEEASQPYVLITYQDVRDNNTPRMKVFKIIAETPEFPFRFRAVAGTRVRPPAPLEKLQIKEENLLGPKFIDRKGELWAKNAGDRGGSIIMVNRYYYKARENFDFPNTPSSDMIPWLDRWSFQKRKMKTLADELEFDGSPIDIVYEVSWPQEPPILRLGQTLTTPKYGLPNIIGQTSVQIAYQQSQVLRGLPSVALIDITRTHKVALEKLPSELEYPRSAREGNRVFFPELPAHLRERFYWDSGTEALCFRGLFLQGNGQIITKPTAIEEAFPLLNVITKYDKTRFLEPLSKDKAFRSALEKLFKKAEKVYLLELPDDAADGRALSAGLTGETGYVTLVFNNSEKLNNKGDPISMQVIKVENPLETGKIVVVQSDNPFSEQVYLRHSGDFVGQPDNYVFNWRISSPLLNGECPPKPENWTKAKMESSDGVGADSIIVEGYRQLLDQCVVVSHRQKNAPSGNSQWTKPALVEGWLKRVRKGINPFDQRISNFRKSEPDRTVSMIEQAGVRYRGAAPLNPEAAKYLGLIEIYETVYRRGKALSIDGSPPISDVGVNKQLLGAARALADLYMLLGNEAYADAVDPTLIYPSAKSGLPGLRYLGRLHNFMNLTPSLIEEELALLRGIDDKLVTEAPAFNRLRWNITRDEGQVAYVVNYHIRDSFDQAINPKRDRAKLNSILSEAKKKYPQGHGDAYGHYLTVLKFYYLLLHHPQFDWFTVPESIDMGGEMVKVDYFDERKFSRAAVARAKSGLEITKLTYRLNYETTSPMQVLEEEEAWGVADWASRTGQGAYIDWVMGNAMLPAEEPNDPKKGLDKINRGTVPELGELVGLTETLQTEMDNANVGLNPLGLPDNFVPFDINYSEVTSGISHFEQMYNRSRESLRKASQILSFALDAKQEQYQEAETIIHFNKSVSEQEFAFNNRLIEIFGTPFTSDIGPGKNYATDYDGPDLYTFQKYKVSALSDHPVQTRTIKLRDGKTMTFTLTSQGYPKQLETDPNAIRRSPGELQFKQQDLLMATAALERTIMEYQSLMAQIEEQFALMQTQVALDQEEIALLDANKNTVANLNKLIRDARIRQMVFQHLASMAQSLANAVADGAPKIFGVIAGMAGGTILDIGAIIRGTARSAALVATKINTIAAESQIVNELDAQQAKELAQADLGIEQVKIKNILGAEQQRNQLQALIRQEPILRLQLYSQYENVRQSADVYAATLAKGDRLIRERNRFRSMTAEETRQHRYRDMAFRLFQDEAIQKYKAQFDIAARDAFLAARAFDYATNFAPEDKNSAQHKYYKKLISARSIGNVNPNTGEVMSGGGGIAEILNEMKQYFDNYAQMMGEHNEIKELANMSLRQGLFQIPYSPKEPDRDSETEWQRKLRQHIVPDVTKMPELIRYCRNLPKGAALVIPFATPLDVSNTLNHFGWIKSGGDSGFNGSLFNKQVRSVQVTFSNYDFDQLVKDPRVYLLPLGMDIFRTPPTNNKSSLRVWQVEPYVLPFGTSGSKFSLRQFYPFPALVDAAKNEEKLIPPDQQLFGRSAYNSQWLLVIPAHNLLPQAKADEVWQYFIGDENQVGVTDIQLRIKVNSIPGL